MPAKYIFRLDDAHPSMDQIKWQRIEKLFNSYNIRPIVAIIPSNCDVTINHSSNNANFWNKAREWQDLGWVIALHGYKHRLKYSSKGLVKINKYSEFVGHSLSQQTRMICHAMKIFSKHGLVPKVWVAPAHGFDLNTIKAILNNTSIRVISDGFSFSPFVRFNIKWVPQQLWRCRKMPFGTWTICLHPSNMNSADFDNLNLFLSNNIEHFIDVPDVIKRKYKFTDSIISSAFELLILIKKVLRG